VRQHNAIAHGGTRCLPAGMCSVRMFRFPSLPRYQDYQEFAMPVMTKHIPNEYSKGEDYFHCPVQFVPEGKMKEPKKR